MPVLRCRWQWLPGCSWVLGTARLAASAEGNQTKCPKYSEYFEVLRSHTALQLSAAMDKPGTTTNDHLDPRDSWSFRQVSAGWLAAGIRIPLKSQSEMFLPASSRQRMST